MNYIKSVVALGFVLGVSACSGVQDKTVDGNISDGGNRHLSQLTAGIWVDPVGCEHWIIDDGFEGYLDTRRTPDGKPVCNSSLPKNTVSGAFKKGSIIFDPS